MGYCPNCKTRLTCGCQKRTSKNGVAGCSKCIAQLNAVQQPKTISTPNTPTGIKATYNGPGRQT